MTEHTETTERIKICDGVYVDGERLLLENKTTGQGKCLSVPFIISLMNNRGQHGNLVHYGVGDAFDEQQTVKDKETEEKINKLYPDEITMEEFLKKYRIGEKIEKI